MKQSILTIFLFLFIIIAKAEPIDFSFSNINIDSNVLNTEVDERKQLIMEILKSNRDSIDSILDSNTIVDYNYSLTFNDSDEIVIFYDKRNSSSKNPTDYENADFEISPLGVAALRNDTITIKKLIKLNALPEYSGYLAPMLSLEGGSIEALDLLVDSNTTQELRLKDAIHICVNFPGSMHELFIRMFLVPEDEIFEDSSDQETDSYEVSFARNRVRCLEKLIEIGFDVNLVDSEGKTPVETLFEFAIEAKLLEDDEYFYSELLLALVKNNAIIELSYNDPKYLEFYCILGIRDQIKTIISSNPELLNQQFPSGKLPLSTLIQSSHFELVSLLLEMGADANQKDKFGSVPLHYIASKKQNSLFKTILDLTENTNLINSENKSPLNYAVENGIYNNVIKLLAKSKNINSTNNRFLIKNLADNVYHKYPNRKWTEDDIKIIRVLKNSNFQISERQSIYGHTSLEMLTSKRLVDNYEKRVLGELLKFSWDSLSLSNAFSKAYKKVNLDFSKAFFNSGLSYESSILILSQQNASDKYDLYNSLVDYIFSNEIDVNIQDERGNTPLMKAILWDNDYLVDKILETRNADLKIDVSGSTAFTIAFYKKKYDLAIKLLSSEGSQVNSGLERLKEIRNFSKDTLILKQILVSQLLKESILNFRGTNGWVTGNDGLRYRKSLLDYRKLSISKSNDLEVHWDISNRSKSPCNGGIEGETPWFPHKGLRSGGRGQKEYDIPWCPIFRYNQISEDKLDKITIKSGAFWYHKLTSNRRQRLKKVYLDHIINIKLKINGGNYNKKYPSYFPSIRVKNNYSNNLIKVYQNGVKTNVLENFEERYFDRSLGDINVIINGQYQGELNYDYEVEYDIGASLPILKTDFDSRLNVYFELYKLKQQLADSIFAKTHQLEWKTLLTRQHLLSELAIEAKYKEFSEQDLKNAISELKITESWFNLIWDIINEVIDINNIDANSLKTAISLAQAEASINDEDLALLNRLEDVSIDPQQDRDEILRLLEKIKSSDIVTDINFKIFKLQVYILELAQFTSNNELINVLESPNYFQNYKPGKSLDKRGNIIIKAEDLDGKGSVILNSIN